MRRSIGVITILMSLFWGSSVADAGNLSKVIRQDTHRLSEFFFRFESHCGPGSKEVQPIKIRSPLNIKSTGQMPLKSDAFPCLGTQPLIAADKLQEINPVANEEEQWIATAISIRKKQIRKSLGQWNKLDRGLQHLDMEVAPRIERDYQNLILLRQIQTAKFNVNNLSDLSFEAKKEKTRALEEQEALIYRQSPVLVHTAFTPWINRGSILTGQAQVASVQSPEQFRKDFKKAIADIRGELWQKQDELEKISQDPGRLQNTLSDPRHNYELLQDLLLATSNSNDPQLRNLRGAECRLQARVIGEEGTEVLRNFAFDAATTLATMGASAYFGAGAKALQSGINIAGVGKMGSDLLAKQEECARKRNLVYSVENASDHLESEVRQCQEAFEDQLLMAGMASLGTLYSEGKVIQEAFKKKGVSTSAALEQRFARSAKFLEGDAENSEILSQIKKDLASNTTENTAKRAAIEEAHQVGSNGTGQYTSAEIAQKTRILKKAGFTEQERRALLRGGVAGEEDRILAHSRFEDIAPRATAGSSIKIDFKKADPALVRLLNLKAATPIESRIFTRV
jgi:hypothetical protein